MLPKNIFAEILTPMLVNMTIFGIEVIADVFKEK